MFDIGQEVVCIDGDWALPDGEPWLGVAPVKGHVYVITACLRFDGRLRVRIKGFGRCLFDADAFRPIRRTDISIFTAMLKTVPKPVPA